MLQLNGQLFDAWLYYKKLMFLILILKKWCYYDSKQDPQIIINNFIVIGLRILGDKPFSDADIHWSSKYLHKS